jgi:luciferase family oxidoreductase group 1
VPGAGLDVPIWLLGSSLFSAELAAVLGLPFAFASHFAPDDLMPALETYRRRFEPSRQLDRPYAMVAASVLAADSDEEAARQFTSQQQSFCNHLRGTPGPVPAPIDDIELYWSPAEKAWVEHALTYSFVGSASTVERGLNGLLEATRPDEVMISAHVHDQAARLRSIEIVAEVRGRLRPAGTCDPLIARGRP